MQLCKKLRIREQVCQYGQLLGNTVLPLQPCTIMSRKKAKRIGAGQPTNLTPAEEQEIEISCQVLQEMGFGLTRETVGVIVVDYLTTIGRDNPFRGLPGPH